MYKRQLNAYASVMSDGQSVPVEIKKVDIVKHDGTGIRSNKVNGIKHSGHEDIMWRR